MSNSTEQVIPQKNITYLFTKKTSGFIPKTLTLTSVLMILSILGFILFDIAYHGIGTISWEFLSSPPKNGMESGGIFPAINPAGTNSS